MMPSCLRYPVTHTTPLVEPRGIEPPTRILQGSVAALVHATPYTPGLFQCPCALHWDLDRLTRPLELYQSIVLHSFALAWAFPSALAKVIGMRLLGEPLGRC